MSESCSFSIINAKLSDIENLIKNLPLIFCVEKKTDKLVSSGLVILNNL